MILKCYKKAKRIFMPIQYNHSLYNWAWLNCIQSIKSRVKACTKESLFQNSISSGEDQSLSLIQNIIIKSLQVDLNEAA